MTTFAFDGKTLVTDGLCISSDGSITCNTFEKARVIDEDGTFIATFTGSTAMGQRCLDWLEEDGDPDSQPSLTDKEADLEATGYVFAKDASHYVKY